MYGLYMIENTSQIFTNYVLFFFYQIRVWCDVKTKEPPKDYTKKHTRPEVQVQRGFCIILWTKKIDLTAQTAQLDLVPPATASAKICSSGTAIALSNTKKEWEHFSEHKMLTGEVLWSFDTFVLEIDSTSLGRVKSPVCGKKCWPRKSIENQPLG